MSNTHPPTDTRIMYDKPLSRETWPPAAVNDIEAYRQAVARVAELEARNTKLAEELINVLGTAIGIEARYKCLIDHIAAARTSMLAIIQRLDKPAPVVDKAALLAMVVEMTAPERDMQVTVEALNY